MAGKDEMGTNSNTGYTIRESFQFPGGSLCVERDRRAGDQPSEIMTDSHYGSSSAQPYTPEATIRLFGGVYRFQETIPGRLSAALGKHHYVRE
jgi:hypothetical protein